MTLDDLLKQSAAWFDQALKRPIFDKVGEAAIKFPEEQRARRMQELKTRIDDLSRRKDEATASYDRAIALERAELENLARQKPPAAPVMPEARPVRATRAKRK
jgi:hypothetical protein